MQSIRAIAIGVWCLDFAGGASIGKPRRQGHWHRHIGGHLVQHVNVAGTNTATNIASESKLESAGLYSTDDLGPCDATIEEAGFRNVRVPALTLTLEGVVVPVDATDAQVRKVVENPRGLGEWRGKSGVRVCDLQVR
jgi:hypothetical protein